MCHVPIGLFGGIGLSHNAQNASPIVHRTCARPFEGFRLPERVGRLRRWLKPAVP
jgi:hypothetical protein